MKNIFKYRIKKVENMSLTKQLVLVTLVALVISTFILGIVLPNILKPYYEMSIYSHLEQPASYIRPETNKMGEDIAFIIITKSGAIYTSDNLNSMVKELSYNEIISMATEQKGKIQVGDSTYYYLWGGKATRNLIITDNKLIIEAERSLLQVIFPTMIATISITVVLLFTWSQYILTKIKKLDKKTKGLITGEKVEGKEFVIADELNELYTTIEKVDKQLKEKDEYKNMMFQNLSHELKTPISVIKSYIEGVQDEVVDIDEAMKIISEEAESLSKQVETILQINKIDFIKDSKKYQDTKVTLDELIYDVVEKHRLIRSDIQFIININNEMPLEYRGTYEMWKAVLDNLMGNFIRYAKSKIEINVEKDAITFFNDGEQIKANMIDKIFMPYVKGDKGQTGLGLSIVKKIVNLFGYDIKVKNVPNGVIFEIT